jgi:hypothetical protein
MRSAAIAINEEEHPQLAKMAEELFITTPLLLNLFLLGFAEQRAMLHALSATVLTPSYAKSIRRDAEA